MSRIGPAARRAEWWDRIRRLRETEYRAWPFELARPQDHDEASSPQEDAEREVEYL